jgi:hypothetical protein
VIDEQASDFKQYGLDPRASKWLHSGGKEHKLLLGQKTPTGPTSTRGCPTSRACSWSPSFLESTFNKSTFDLRDKTILKVDRDKVDAWRSTCRIGRRNSPAGRRLAADRADRRARADFGAIEGILGRLNSTPMKAIVAAEVSDRRAAGVRLDKPAATVRRHSGSSQAGLAIGKSAGEGVVYAKDLSRPMVFTVERRSPTS